ncbi:MAG: hypothetical protein F6K36_00390 [Symploca sp. SIO3C6]|nr:hypothetical protein [Symploca sp. SIO3C6]
MSQNEVRVNIFRFFGTVIGIFVVCAFAYWGIVDFIQLAQANQRLTQEALSLPERGFRYLSSTEEAHRINIGFDSDYFAKQPRHSLVNVLTKYDFCLDIIYIEFYTCQ